MSWVKILAGFFSGVIGSMGLGGGAVLLIFLRVFLKQEQLASQGINLVFFLPIALFSAAIYAYNKKLKYKLILPLSLFSAVGAVVGSIVSKQLGGEITSVIFGIALILLGIKELIATCLLIYKKKCGNLKIE